MIKLKVIRPVLILWLCLAAGMLSAQVSPLARPDTLTTGTDTLLSRIQSAQNTLTEVTSANKKGYGTHKISSDLAGLKMDIDPIRKDLEETRTNIDKKSLLNDHLILSDAQLKLDGWQKTLARHSSSLQQWSNQLTAITSDSLLLVNAADTTSRQLYHQQLAALKMQSGEASGKTALQLDTVNRLLAEVSSQYSTVTGLLNNLQDRLQETGKVELSQESPYLWKAPATDLHSSLGEVLKNTYQGQHQILSYFIKATWDNRILLILLGVLFFLWVHNNFKKAASPELQQELGKLEFPGLKPYPVYATLIVMLSLTPVFEPNSPAFYLEINQFAILMVLSFRFWKQLDKPSLKLWLLGVILYITVIFTSSMVSDAIWMRCLLILLNIGSLCLAVMFYRKMHDENFISRFVRPLAILYMGFNLLAILVNIFGRTSLAKVFSVTAIVGLTQVVSLAVFVQVLIDALELQIKISSCSGGLFSRINLNKTRLSFKKLLTSIALILWLLVFMINLSISGAVFGLLHQLLDKPRNFGSLSFTLNNVLLFTLIIYIANLLQKHIGLLFGESAVDFNSKGGSKNSKLSLLRLVIIFAGVILAVAVSGVPIDKLTVAIGALGVGIGLGLQNIVNNFVSGIILIFEKPFRVGDFVELADKKGKVQDIGIRSSKMLTAQGSEVIIPNGDLLSGRLVNWTLSNDYVKTEITFKVNIDADLPPLYKLIREEIGKLSGTVRQQDAEILMNAVTADSIELKVLVWIDNIYIEASFKSSLLTQLLQRFKDSGVKFLA